jgi:hypothetical protein
LDSSSNAPWSWWNAREVELAEKTAVLGHAALTLKDLYGSQTEKGKCYLDHKMTLEVPAEEITWMLEIVTWMDTVVCWSW